MHGGPGGPCPSIRCPPYGAVRGSEPLNKTWYPNPPPPQLAQSPQTREQPLPQPGTSAPAQKAQGGRRAAELMSRHRLPTKG